MLFFCRLPAVIFLLLSLLSPSWQHVLMQLLQQLFNVGFLGVRWVFQGFNPLCACLCVSVCVFQGWYGSAEKWQRDDFPAPDLNVSMWVTPKRFRRTFLNARAPQQNAADSIRDKFTHVFQRQGESVHTIPAVIINPLYFSCRLSTFTLMSTLWWDVLKPHSLLEWSWLLGGKGTLRRALKRLWDWQCALQVCVCRFIWKLTLKLICFISIADEKC